MTDPSGPELRALRVLIRLRERVVQATEEAYRALDRLHIDPDTLARLDGRCRRPISRT